MTPMILFGTHFPSVSSEYFNQSPDFQVSFSSTSQSAVYFSSASQKAFITGAGNNYSVYMQSTWEFINNLDTITGQGIVITSGALINSGITNSKKAYLITSKSADPNNYFWKVGQVMVFSTSDVIKVSTYPYSGAAAKSFSPGKN